MWIRGGMDLKSPKFEHIFVAVKTFFSFFCATTFDISLLLIVCALKWYIKSLYRHLFLEDISKNARVNKTFHFLICGKLYCQAPWPTRPNPSVLVAKALSSDRMASLFFFRWSLPPPPLSYSFEKRRDHRNCVGGRGGITEIAWVDGKFLWSRFFSTLYLRGGGVTGRRKVYPYDHS